MLHCTPRKSDAAPAAFLRIFGTARTERLSVDAAEDDGAAAAADPPVADADADVAAAATAAAAAAAGTEALAPQKD